MKRLPLHLLALALAATGPGLAAQTPIAPDDPGLVYTEYVHATVDGARAQFDRDSFLHVANQHSPGTRINFRTNATRVEASFDYFEACMFPGCGRIRIEVDGVLQPTLLGVDNTPGPHSQTVYLQGSPVTRRYSILLPYAADVDFLGLELTGGTESLAAPPHRPGLLWAAYGDSITQGFNASDIGTTYPYLAARDLEWSVLNLGFAGQILQVADATPLAALGADFVSVAIGTNDYWAQTTEVDFKAHLNQFITDFRAGQPDVPFAFVVPPWVDYESLPNTLGLLPADYRGWMRELVLQRARVDKALVLIEGLDMVSPGAPFFTDGLHPGNAGFAEYGERLAGLDVVRNGGFETDDLAWQAAGSVAYDSAQRSTGLQSLRIGPSQGIAYQVLTGIAPGLCYTATAQSMLTDLGDQASVAVQFLDENDDEIEAFTLPVLWDTYQAGEIEFTAPDVFASVRVWAGKPNGSGTLYVDDLSVRLVEPASVDVYGCINPHASLRVVSGRPGLGELLTVGIDNPLGTQAGGATLPGLMLALQPDPNFPCGTPIPGFGMGGPGALGEVLISFLPPNPLDPILIGPVWNGAGFPAPLDLPIPDDCTLAGFSVYTQGFLFDSTPGAQVQLGFTEGLRLRIGP